MHQGSAQCYCRGLTEGIHQFPLLSVQLFCKCQTLRNANLADLFLASPSNGFFHQASDEGGPFALTAHGSPFTFSHSLASTLGEALSAHRGQHCGRNLPHLQPTGTEILFARGWAPPAQKPHCSVASPASQKPISCHDLVQGCSSSAPMSLHAWTGLQSATSMYWNVKPMGVLVESQFHPSPSLSFLPWTFLEECWLVSHPYALLVSHHFCPLLKHCGISAHGRVGLHPRVAIFSFLYVAGITSVSIARAKKPSTWALIGSWWFWIPHFRIVTVSSFLLWKSLNLRRAYSFLSIVSIKNSITFSSSSVEEESLAWLVAIS